MFFTSHFVQVVAPESKMIRRDGLSFRFETKLSIHSTDDLDRVLQEHAFVLPDKDRDRSRALPEARGLTHAELFDTNKEQQEVRKRHMEMLLRSGRILRCSAASHVSEASASGFVDVAKRAKDDDMIYYWVPSEYQVDLSDKSFEHRLGEVRKLWRQITDPTPAGECSRAAVDTVCRCNAETRHVPRGLDGWSSFIEGQDAAVSAAYSSVSSAVSAAGVIVSRVLLVLLFIAASLLTFV
jgi:hypothetical protein